MAMFPLGLLLSLSNKRNASGYEPSDILVLFHASHNPVPNLPDVFDTTGYPRKNPLPPANPRNTLPHRHSGESRNPPFQQRAL
jgi:hypothetical protein